MMINKVSFLPADTRGRSCSSGEPEMRSSPPRKYFPAHLDSCRGRTEVVDGQRQTARASDASAERLDLFSVFQGSAGCHVQQRQQPPAEAATIQVSLISVLLRQDGLVTFDREEV